MAGGRLFLSVLVVRSGMEQKLRQEENGGSWRASGYVRLYVEAGSMSDRERGPVTPPAAAVKLIYQSDEGKQPRRNGWAAQRRHFYCLMAADRNALQGSRGNGSEKINFEASFMYERIIRGRVRNLPLWYLNSVQATSQIKRALAAHAHATPSLQ